MPLKWALTLGACAFLASILLDFITVAISSRGALKRMIIVAMLLGLFQYLRISADAATKINLIAKLSALLSAAYLFAVLLSDGNPRHYPETRTALLPMYFFTYGQMFMSLWTTLGFGWSTVLAMPVAGHWLGAASQV